MAREITVQAGTQYGDWRGTAAADNTFQLDLAHFIREKKWMGSEDVLVAWEIYSGEIARRDGGVQLSITAHFAHASAVKGARASGGKVTVKSICFDMAALDFLEKFKQFAVAVSLHGDFGQLLAGDPVSVN